MYRFQPNEDLFRFLWDSDKIFLNISICLSKLVESFEVAETWNKIIDTGLQQDECKLGEIATITPNSKV